MYSGSGFSEWEIGDVDVFIHNGEYHLFHLIIPNHDYIAHAISPDGISWRRVSNALFVGDPGEWDDDMLWTMHVSRDANQFRMYYTGLQRKDRGNVQKVGLAVSEDLYHWTKVSAEYGLPLESTGPYYEDRHNNPRRWLSFRDPFRFEHEGKVYLLICARSSFGPVSRRGCIGLACVVDGRYELRKPLLYPMVYDDVECPCVFELNGRYYILGSIREDIKVRYWFAPEFLGEYHSFRSDVLLPQGNYAARVVQDQGHLLIYHFFFMGHSVNTLRVLPPPKELDTDEQGRLVLKSYYRWKQMAGRIICQANFPEVAGLLGNPTGSLEVLPDKWTVQCRSGYEIYAFQKPAASFIWEGTVTIEGMGKFGLVTDIDSEGNGYFISFDVTNGLVQIRAWGFNEKDNLNNFIFNNIQSNLFSVNESNSYRFQLIRFGNYIELSLDGIVKLTLLDYRYTGPLIGLYSASSVISLKDSILRELPDPKHEYDTQGEMVE